MPFLWIWLTGLSTSLSLNGWSLQTLGGWADLTTVQSVVQPLAPSHRSISSHSADQMASDPFELMNSEAIGQLAINLPAEEVLTLLGQPNHKNEPTFWGADGLYHQSWHYPQQGITLDMVAETKTGSQAVASVRITSPSQFKTQRGIGIGDSYAKVQNAYGADQSRDTSAQPEQPESSPDYFVAGSIYGGLIFLLQNDQVTEIFLGAAAE
ncbi:MAG: hypothetical protein ACRC8A_03490 [Microcoleaceae cyanobacterium]